ncbi:MAG: RagB/SusD family nutrient uptake outer membrane protein [Dysgonamonadaceae bacterium]|jgi:hypothetical protein|nr:RagB/SusD family nutrient uptake outer membrane protein [Dysgonamonadaceae bacterium]
MEGATDNAYVRASSGKTQAIANGSHSTADAYIESIWGYRYEGIKMCNQLTDNINRVPGLTDSLKNLYLSQVRVIRALHYHELVTKFQDVPYITTAISFAEANKVSPTKRDVIVNNILTELDDILNNKYLPFSYPATADYGRITHYAAEALKARILLNEGRYAEVKTTTEDIIRNGNYELHPQYDQLFVVNYEKNKEIMLSVQYALNMRENSGNYQFLPPSLAGIANIVPIKTLVDSYIMLNGQNISEAQSGYSESDPWKNRDPRLMATICYDGGVYIKADGSQHKVTTAPDSKSNDRLQPGTSVITTTSGYYFKKFYDNQFITAQRSGLNYPVIRYADVLLMYAESCAETGTLTSADWDMTIKKIRQRAGFTIPEALNMPSGKTKEELINTIRNERRCELAFEGLRLKDIMRWKISENVLNGDALGMYIGTGFSNTVNGYYKIETRQFDKSKHYLWPIPQSERDINKNLRQNPNW